MTDLRSPSSFLSGDQDSHEEQTGNDSQNPEQLGVIVMLDHISSSNSSANPADLL